MQITPELKRWATPLQASAIDAMLKHGSIRAAAKALGVSKTAVQQRLDAVRRRAAAAGYAPEANYTHPQPEGFHVKGVSSLYRRGEAEPVIQWVKSAKDYEDRLQALREAMAAAVEPFRGAFRPARPPRDCMSDLLSVYPMGDPHIGMLAWKLETGEDFDLKIAERNLVTAVDHLVELSPPSENALIINLGDFFHSDNQSNRTARSGHALDVDSRWARVLTVGIRGMRRCIDRALTKHQHVTVINEIGNHDDHSSIMLALCLAGMYEREPRVTIDTSPAKFHWHRFGACLIGVTHGDTCKAKDLPEIMATDRPKDWGETKHRRWYTGHVHHDSLKDFRGCTVETFRTLAAKDAWHAAQGYRSERDMQLHIWHRERGLISRHIVGVEELQ